MSILKRPANNKLLFLQPPLKTMLSKIDLERTKIHFLNFLNSISHRIRILIKLRQEIQQGHLRTLLKNLSLFLETSQIMDRRKQKSLQFCGQALENRSLKINLHKQRMIIIFFQTRPLIIRKQLAKTTMKILTCNPLIRTVWLEESMEDRSHNKEKFEMIFQEAPLKTIADQEVVSVLMRIKLKWFLKIALI